MPNFDTRVKCGGRQKGTPNKNKATVIEHLDALNFNVLEELMKTLPDLDPPARARMLYGLLDFIYPKKKAVEIVAEVKTDAQESEDVKQLVQWVQAVKDIK